MIVERGIAQLRLSYRVQVKRGSHIVKGNRFFFTAPRFPTQRDIDVAPALLVQPACSMTHAHMRRRDSVRPTAYLQSRVLRTTCFVKCQARPPLLTTRSAVPRRVFCAVCLCFEQHLFALLSLDRRRRRCLQPSLRQSPLQRRAFSCRRL